MEILTQIILNTSHKFKKKLINILLNYIFVWIEEIASINSPIQGSEIHIHQSIIPL